MNSNEFYTIIFQWVLPFATMIGLYVLLTKYLNSVYERMDIEIIWKRVIQIAIVIGLLTVGWYFITHQEWFKNAVFYTKSGAEWVGNTEQAKATGQFVNSYWQRFLQFLLFWIPVYFRAFVVVWVISTFIYIRSLMWRVSFIRGANIIVSTALVYPFLSLKYLFGYQTPFFDFLQSRLLIAKLKENLNDSYFKAIQGVDDKGQKFESGIGGTVQIQRYKATAIAIKRTRAKVTTAGGIRRAELITKNSRETDTDKLIEQSLQGFGKRLVAPSIRFQDNPILNADRGGFVFDSDVSYKAGDELGSWLGIFSNPLADGEKISNGGQGVFHAIKNLYNGVFRYMLHLSPVAVSERLISRVKELFTPDRTLDNAKYVAQSNLDLSLIPKPVDPETGNDKEAQMKIAMNVAQERISEVTNALNIFNISGVFYKLRVGGNTAIYEYTLTRDADLPNDFRKLQEGLSQILKTNDLPIIEAKAGKISVAMVNGVNIPVDFRDMIQNRKKGMNTIISGMAGVDALGNNIYVELGDMLPHIMLFGATGFGKTVTIFNIAYSIMSAVDPSMLRIQYIDGKGNSFEFMRNDRNHPNPFTYAQPANASGDIEYARALLKHFERETRRRIELFGEAGVSKLAVYNQKFPDKALYEILVICDEFSAITDLDKTLNYEDSVEYGTVDTFEYIAKMARSVGIHLLLANQTARKEKVPGRITANIAGRVSLKVNEPIESDIALPDSKIPVHLIQQAGEFYSTLNGIRNAEHGNSPFLSDDTMNDLNDSLTKKFGARDYVVTREEVMREIYGDKFKEEEAYNYDVPDTIPNAEASIDELVETISKYPEWAVANKDSAVFTRNKNVNADNFKERRENKKIIQDAIKRVTK